MDNKIYDKDAEGNKIYDGTKLLMFPLNWLFLSRLKRWFRRVKLKQYKRKQTLVEKQSGVKTYLLHFKLNIKDIDNPCEIPTIFQMEVPAHAAVIAKMRLKESVMHKIGIEIVKLDTLDE